MPCSDGSNYGPSTDELQKKVTKLTQILCFLCREVCKTAPIILHRHKPLQDWWNQHEAYDRMVEAALNKEKELGFNGLSDEEKTMVLHHRITPRFV